MAATKANGSATTTAVATATPPASKLVSRSVQVSTPGELMQLAEIMWKGGAGQMPNLDRPEKVARVILAGMEVGLSAAQAIDSIMMGKTGRCAMWGDGLLAVVRASGLLESIEEYVENFTNEEGRSDRRGVCKLKRFGDPLGVRAFTFSIAEANKAGLIERARGQKGDGPWITYQDRMLLMRARGFGLRDVFTDAIKGLITAEELIDSEREAVEVKVISATPNVPQLAAAGGQQGQIIVKDCTFGSPADSAPAKVTDDQLARIKEIRGMMCVARSLKDPGEQKAAWGELLAGYGVKSATEFTADQAADFISKELPKHDPFGNPASPGPATAPATTPPAPAEPSTSPPSTATATT